MKGRCDLSLDMAKQLKHPMNMFGDQKSSRIGPWLVHNENLKITFGHVTVIWLDQL